MPAKYPRTLPLLTAARPDGVPFAELAGRTLVVEAKVDDSHLSLSFVEGELRFAHRGQYLSGEREFAVVKAWAYAQLPALQQRLGERYELHGGCLYAKHTAFYDALPAYFLEYDVRDRLSGEWLATARRRELLAGLDLCSVAVLHQGPLAGLAELESLAGPSPYKSAGWRAALQAAAAQAGVDGERVWAETDDSDHDEGLYVKVEEDGLVRARYKLIRPGFLAALLASGGHWRSRPLIANRLAEPTRTS